LRWRELLDRSVSARAFRFLVEGFGARKCRFGSKGFVWEGIPLSCSGVDVWLERLRLETARAQGRFLHVLKNCRLLVLQSQEPVLVGSGSV
jgi:hypothetical protein